MDKIKKSIMEGVNILNKTIDMYSKLHDKANEYSKSLEIALSLNDESLDNLKYNNSIKKIEAISSRINYIKFIIKELDKIEYFVQTDNKCDFNNYCMYYGSNVIFYSKEFLMLSEKEMFETILNHIFYYTGCLYIVINDDVKLSYLTTAFAICYGKHIDFKLGRDIYKLYAKDLGVTILNTNKNYRNFIIRNNEIMPFFKKSNRQIYSNSTIFLNYRILLGNNITLKNMNIKIADVNECVSICEVSNLFSNEDELFSIA